MLPRRLLPCLAAGVVALATLGSTPSPLFQRYLAGNAADAVPAAVPGGMALIGGGSDPDEAFRWMIERAGRGDFVVVRARGGAAYNDYVLGLGPVDSVETLVVPNIAAANLPEVVATVDRAEAVFIAGGDQSSYVRIWKGTGLQAALNRVVARKAVLGGTSAGLAVLGEFSFAALRDTITSRAALADPLEPRITIERGFLDLPLLRGAITDSHFVERNRMGRLVAFLSRIQHDHALGTVRGVAVDRETAVLVDHDGQGVVAGKGPVYFLAASERREIVAPLSTGFIDVYRARAGNTFDFRTWTGAGGAAYRVRADRGTLTSDQPDGFAY